MVLRKKKNRSIQYSAEPLTAVDYADDLALLANTPAQDEFQFHSLEQAAGGISLYVNSKKTEYMRYKKKAIPNLNGNRLK